MEQRNRLGHRRLQRAWARYGKGVCRQMVGLSYPALVRFDASKQAGTDPRAEPLDVTDRQQPRSVHAGSFPAGKRVDVLVYCAAILILSPCELTAYRRVCPRDADQLSGYDGFRCAGHAENAFAKGRENRVLLLHQRLAWNSVPERLRCLQARRGRVCGMPRHGMRGIRRPGFRRRTRRSSRRKPALPSFRVRREGSPYAGAFAAGMAKIRNDEDAGLIPSKLAAKHVVRNVNRKRMKFRLRIAKIDQKAAVVLHDALPSRMNMRILRAITERRGNHHIRI